MTRVLAILMLTVVAATAARAEQTFTFGDYIVHYIAMPSAELPAPVARAYGIERSSKRGVVVLNVQHRDAPLIGVAARVEGTIMNLIGQSRGSEFREFSEQQAIYSISEFSFTNLETMRFDLRIYPADSKQSGRLQFSQQFWVNPG